ncbi:unnamed protein product, partial [Pleuronectes platessa]
DIGARLFKPFMMATLTLSDRLTGAQKCGSGLTGLNSQAGARLRKVVGCRYMGELASSRDFVEWLVAVRKQQADWQMQSGSHWYPVKGEEERSSVSELRLVKDQSSRCILREPAKV